jgi:hypothetical protein
MDDCRRECLGELVQIDGSEHAWFEDRGPACTLLAVIDDATSRLMQLRFVASESAFQYFRATRSYLDTHGKPVAFYSDKHSISRVNKKDADGGDRVTQFGRALGELNIDIICANIPQAKGRVERAFGTLQDRLVKELRRADIASIDAANAWLPTFMTEYNRRSAGADPRGPRRQPVSWGRPSQGLGPAADRRNPHLAAARAASDARTSPSRAGPCRRATRPAQPRRHHHPGSPRYHVGH